MFAITPTKIEALLLILLPIAILVIASDKSELLGTSGNINYEAMNQPTIENELYLSADTTISSDMAVKLAKRLQKHKAHP